MSDESETETGLIKHTPIWRSKELNKQIKKWNKRRNKITRLVLSPLNDIPRHESAPFSAPSWTVENSESVNSAHHNCTPTRPRALTTVQLSTVSQATPVLAIVVQL